MDRAELLEFMKKARKQLKKYHVPMDEQTVTLRISLDTLENVLSEQPEIVRCKDCKYSEEWVPRCGDRYCILYDQRHIKNWYCAAGERRDDDDN